MVIRHEVPADEKTISAVVTKAFRGAEYRNGNEATIVEALRRAQSLTVSLVATEHERIVGHIAFSPVRIGGRRCGWFGLGPVAVRPDWQRKGIGSALVRAGLDMLRAKGASGCVVLGEPGYYGRFGFTTDPGLCLEGVPAEYFQRLSFDGQSCAGLVSYHPAFDGT